MSRPASASLPRIILLGGGFGGLAAARGLARCRAEVLLIDRSNHHLFQPLLYQVATAGLGATDVAQPIRSILARQRNVSVHMTEATSIDLAARSVTVAGHGEPLAWDRLVVALGVETDYFGNDRWAPHAPGLKTLGDAARIRSRVLRAYERAENIDDERDRARLMTSVVIGGGPTGVEMAGALIELARVALRRDFRRIDPGQARVVLVEAAPRLLGAFDDRLADRTAGALRAMGVEVRLGTRVTDLRAGAVELGAETIEAATIVWAAGVRAPAITRTLGVPLDRAGRVIVAPDGSIPGHPSAFAIGDIAAFTDGSGTLVPGLAQGAMQAGRHVARLIAAELPGPPRDPAERAAFVYRDKGLMATIGRKRAVVQTRRLRFDGFFAWLAWLLIHLVFLVDLRSRIAVFTQWIWAYVSFRPGARLIVAPPEEPPPSAGEETSRRT